MATPGTWRTLAPVDVLLVGGDADRSYVMDDTRYSPMLDSLGDRLAGAGLTTASVAARFSRIVGGAAYGNPRSCARDLMAIALRARLRRLMGVGGEDEQVADEARFWERILDRTRPYAILAIQPDAALCRAAAGRDVLVYDVQHGVVSTTAATSYYSSHRFEHTPAQDLPSGYLCWDDASAEAIATASPRYHPDVIAIGNPWLLRFAEAAAGDAVVAAELAQLDRPASSQPTILVTLQYNQAEYLPGFASNGFLADALVEIIRDTATRYNWRLRLHPSQLLGTEADRLEAFLQMQFGALANVEWRATTRVALPALLTCVDLHLTHYSAVTHEAATAGIRTGLVGPLFGAGELHAGLFAAERRTGLATVVAPEVGALRSFIEESLLLGRAAVEAPSASAFNTFVERLRAPARSREHADLAIGR